MENVKKILIISSDKNLLEVLTFCFDGWGYEVVVRDTPLQDILLVKKLSPDVVIVDVHSATKPHLEICRMLKDDFLTASIPIITLINKRQLRSQLLNIKQGVDDYLIKPPDPLDLRIRVEMAVRRSQYSFYTNPLTGLPGARIIEEHVRERLKKQDAFTVGYIDIDHFKCFNDAYGYLKGDMVILQTAYMLYTVTKQCGSRDDFIGHIGGDDFIFISTPHTYEDISENFIALFDKVTPFHYPQEDRERGFIIATDRQRKASQMPLMSVSVALVNSSLDSQLRSMVQINERIAEIKHYLKSLPGSKYMVDRRNLKEQYASPKMNPLKPASAPQGLLGQILLERGILTPDQLDEALKVHWKKGIILGEVLKELKMIKEEELATALDSQKSSFPL